MQPEPCFETICFENHTFRNLEYHQARLDRTRLNLYGLKPDWKLTDVLQIPEDLSDIKYKCRISYSKEPEKIEWTTYVPREINQIQRVYDGHIDYTFKYENRQTLNSLYAQRGKADEILIIKNGLVTDSAFCNVALYDGDKWYTPAKPLLVGTQRTFLLDSGILTERKITENDLRNYSHIRLFNAMVYWEIAPTLSTAMIL